MQCKILRQSLCTIRLPKPVTVQVVKLGSMGIRVQVNSVQFCQATLQLITETVEENQGKETGILGSSGFFVVLCRRKCSLSAFSWENKNLFGQNCFLWKWLADLLSST